MKKTLLVSSFLILAYGVYFFTAGDFHPTKDFSLQNMLPQHAYKPQWDVHPISEQEKDHIHSVLNQNFKYIGCGNQIYVFFSEDNKYVLKIVKQHRYIVPRWIRYLLPPMLSYRTKKIGHKEHSLDRDFNSYKIAFDRLKEETALLFVHLNPQDDFHHKTTLIDKENIAYNVDLHDYEFILQDMAEMVYPTIEKHMANGDTLSAKAAIDSLLELLYSRCKKGIHDTNPNFEKNFAFLNNKAVQIDIGRFSLKAPEYFPTIKETFKEYLHDKFPELEEYYDAQYLAYAHQFH